MPPVATEARLVELASRKTELCKPGSYKIRFANFDERLTLWVDDTLPFGDGVAYDSPQAKGPTPHDLEPAGVGAKGAALQVRRLKLWRDI
jgi:signal peptidase I